MAWSGCSYCIFSEKQKQVVEVIWQPATSLSYMDSSIVFARLCQCAPELIHAFLGQPEFKYQTASQVVQPFFVQLMEESRYTLQRAAPFPLKIAHWYGGSGPPSNTRLLGLIRAHNWKGISIGAAVLQGWVLLQTDWQTTLLSL